MVLNKLNYNKSLKNIFLSLVLSNMLVFSSNCESAFAYQTAIDPTQISKELSSIISRESRNSNIRKAVYFLGTAYAVYKTYKYFNPAAPAFTKIEVKIQGSSKASSFLNNLGQMGENLDQEQHANLLNSFYEFAGSGILKTKSWLDLPKDVLLGGFNFMKNLAMQDFMIMVIGGHIYTPIKKILWSDFDSFVSQNTKFTQLSRMIDAVADSTHNKNPDANYKVLSQENLRFYNHKLIQEAQKVLAYMLYTKISNTKLSQTQKNTLDILVNNFTKTINDLSRLIELHDLSGIHNRMIALDNISNMFKANLEDDSE